MLCFFSLYCLRSMTLFSALFFSVLFPCRHFGLKFCFQFFALLPKWVSLLIRISIAHVVYANKHVNWRYIEIKWLFWLVNHRLALFLVCLSELWVFRCCCCFSIVSFRLALYPFARENHTYVCMCCHILSVTFFLLLCQFLTLTPICYCVYNWIWQRRRWKKNSQIRRRAYERNIEIEKQNNHFKWIKWIYAHKKCSVIGDLKVRDPSKKSLWIQ